MSDHEFAPRTAAYQADPAEVHRVLLLYSGGLDTSVMLRWIQERYEAEVVTLTVNLGQPGEDYAVIEGKARQIGAVECHIVDGRDEFANEYLAPAIKANALYGGGYPLFTALGRPLIAKLAVEYARRSGCDTIAHGCTGKGNDQVRIDGTIATLAPELKVIAPVREWAMGARRRSPTRASTGSRSRAASRSCRTRSTTTSGVARRRAAGSRTSPARPRRTSSSSSRRRASRPISRRGSTCGSKRGLPVALDGEQLALAELIERVGELGARHGVGIIDHIEDRIVGLKVRDIYEAPAAAIILAAHAELEKLVCTIHQNQFKAGLDRQWAYLVYAGLWWEPLRGDLDAYMESVNAQVSGTIGLELYKGTARVITRASPNAVYDQSLASFAESGGLFSQTASPGFIELWTLQSRMAWRLRNG